MELVLNTYGVSLNRDNEGFVISSKEGSRRIPAEGIKSIQIGRGAQITSDAIMLAVEREIEILFMDRAGNPVAESGARNTALSPQSGKDRSISPSPGKLWTGSKMSSCGKLKTSRH